MRRSKAGRRRAYVLIAVHVLIGLHFLHWGLTGESVTPVEPSEAMQTIESGRINAGFLLFVSLIASTLIFGRWFCGWACHVVALQDLSAWLLAKMGLKPRPVRSRLLVLTPWVVAAYMFLWPVVKDWLLPAEDRTIPNVGEWQLDVWTESLWETFPGPIMAIVTLVVVGFLIVWWLGAKGFCTYGCPYGAFFTLADRVAPVTIKVTDACEACGHCTSVCSSNVRVHEEVARHGQIVDPGCMKCLDCVSVCPKDALYVGRAMPKPLAVSQQRLQARADFTWPEELALLVVAIVATQFTFRGLWLGEGVPLLLAVGLGVITAVLSLLCWRLLRRSDMAFQHTTLKQQGRWLPAGRWALLALSAWLAFAAHTFIGQCWKSSALEVAREPVRERLARKPVAIERFEAAHASVDAALGWDLVDDPWLLQARGLLRRELQRHADAERDLRAALAGLPFLELAGTALAIYRLRAADFVEAEALARRVLERYPGNPTALAIVRQIEAMPK